MTLRRMQSIRPTLVSCSYPSTDLPFMSTAEKKYYAVILGAGGMSTLHSLIPSPTLFPPFHFVESPASFILSRAMCEKRRRY